MTKDGEAADDQVFDLVPVEDGDDLVVELEAFLVGGACHQGRGLIMRRACSSVGLLRWNQPHIFAWNLRPSSTRSAGVRERQYARCSALESGHSSLPRTRNDNLRRGMT
jgi:hypothetical protein